MSHKIAVTLADGTKTNADYQIDDKPTPKVRQFICVRCGGRLVAAQVTNVDKRPAVDFVEVKEL